MERQAGRADAVRAVEANSAEEALEVANDTSYGLFAGVSTNKMTELKWITIQLGQRQFPF
jgi:acyl-CoA reductase-like NAD-dependent aldehyde dehydrogenase